MKEHYQIYEIGGKIMKSFIVSWYVSGYTGTFRYLVVANDIDEAKKIWDKFALNNDEIECSWKQAEKGVKNHYGGYITWKENGNCDKEIGCYELDFNDWNTSSDHLWDQFFFDEKFETCLKVRLYYSVWFNFLKKNKVYYNFDYSGTSRVKYTNVVGEPKKYWGRFDSEPSEKTDKEISIITTSIFN